MSADRWHRRPSPLPPPTRLCRRSPRWRRRAAASGPSPPGHRARPAGRYTLARSMRSRPHHSSMRPQELEEADEHEHYGYTDGGPGQQRVDGAGGGRIRVRHPEVQRDQPGLRHRNRPTSVGRWRSGPAPAYAAPTPARSSISIGTGIIGHEQEGHRYHGRPQMGHGQVVSALTGPIRTGDHQKV